LIILLLLNVTIKRIKSQEILPWLVSGRRLPGMGGPVEKTASVSLVLAQRESANVIFKRFRYLG
jgi:hypothetical protein